VIKRRRNGRHYVRRNKNGEFKKEVSVGQPVTTERRRKGETKVEPAVVSAET
jgi:hypothetical protein